MRVLIVPDKFKGTLTSHQAARAIARGWRKARPKDFITTLPMTDGGDGFGEVFSELLGARARPVRTIDAAHRTRRAFWWWAGNEKTAIVESAKFIGLATLPHKKFHPFQLDTFGLGKVLMTAANAGARRCIVGIGGSATNDGGFGVARELGWKFFDESGDEIDEWWRLRDLAEIRRPKAPLKLRIIVAVDVLNPLLGANGCSRVYGPQKGLFEFDWAEKCLSRMATVLKTQHGLDYADVPGAGAAGGLGFGLMAFADAKLESGFELFARHAKLHEHIDAADIVVTGEGAIDLQTRMGKGVGRIAELCGERKIPCVGLAGMVDPAVRKIEVISHRGIFSHCGALTDITTLESARMKAAYFLERLASEVASKVC
jgi:glycerate 2-kinase